MSCPCGWYDEIGTKMSIYLDNAATTKPDDASVARAGEYLKEKFFNPSALYGGGIAVHNDIKRARETLLSRIADTRTYDLIFTSGGTEADNTAVFCGAKRGNAVTTQGEHAAVFQSFTALKNRGIEPRFAPLNRDGSVDREALLRLVDEKTSFVSVVHVNNETGAVNDIAEIADMVKRKNPRTIFHSDGVQAFGKIPVRLTNVDLYSASAHKIGGVKGCGALVKRKTLTLAPYLYGGGQENGLRSGTENVFGIMAFCYAAERRFASQDVDGERLRGLRERLWSMLDPSYFKRLSPEDGTPYILTVTAEGLRGEILQRLLEARGVIVGTGSACSSKHPFSRVMQACGYGEKQLYGVLRLSFSPETTENEVVEAACALNESAKELSKRTK